MDQAEREHQVVSPDGYNREPRGICILWNNEGRPQNFLSKGLCDTMEVSAERGKGACTNKHSSKILEVVTYNGKLRGHNR
jgi:hypothetical protein